VLKVSITDTATERIWVVQGRLVGPWVRELRTCWKKTHRTHSEQRCVIDLNDVTSIDKSGERLLLAMAKKGAELRATGMYTKHLLEKVRAAGNRSLSKLLVCLFIALLASATVPAHRALVGSEFGKRTQSKAQAGT
jgi:anti-anti-sigma regulatory factor